jgi:predicted ArsR family transcriptional regulator
MLLPVFKDLIKPQWRTVLEQLKRQGGLPVSELSRELGASYMAVKQHCEELKKLGYLNRSRVPRTVVGRPEIFYSLSPKADALFPEAGVDFTLTLLEELKAMAGENMPDKLLFQHFQKQQEAWEPLINKCGSLAEKALKLSSLREKTGCHSKCHSAKDGSLRIEEFHNPLQRLFDRYPRAMAMELRMIEQLLGARVERSERPSGRGSQPQIVFQIG